MILHRLTANHDSFRPIEFKEGLNIVLAEKAESSGKKDTRNGVGKSTLVEILLFCLGGQATKGRGIVQDALQSWSFSLEITLRGTRIVVTRSIENPDSIKVSGSTESWPIQPDYSTLFGYHVFTITRWRDLLGWAFFDLNPSVQAEVDHPVPKGLLSCFLRAGQAAYRSAGFHNTSKSDGKEAVNLAYLLRLDWEFIGRIKLLNEHLNNLRTTKSTIEEGIFSGAEGNIERILVEQSKIQAEISELERALTTYDFAPQYERLLKELNDLTQETVTLSNRIASSKRKLTLFKKAIHEEKDTSPEEIEKIFKETGLVFPSSLRRTLSEVLTFHKTIIVNRKGFLNDEITRLEKEIRTLTQERNEKSKLKGEKTIQFSTQDFYTDLRMHQDRLAELKSQEKRHEEWIKNLNDLDQKMINIEMEIEEEKARAQTDFSERKTVLDPILRDFSDFTKFLYDRPGNLSIAPENDDYSISLEMARGASDGVRLMGIFCFDLALLKTQCRFGRKMAFLVHDTPIFDAVDDRQRALALELAAKETLSMHGQYICPMNSDKVPWDNFESGFDFNAHVIRTLSDASPSDSLLGIHFEVDS